MARITEKILVDINYATCENPFYIRWLATGGGAAYDTRPRAGWGYWLFDHSQDFGVQSSDGAKAAVYLEDMEETTTAEKILTRSVNDIVTLTAEVKLLDHVRGLKTIMGASIVEVLIEDETDDWVEVFPVPGSFSEYRTKGNFWEISLQLAFNKQVIQAL